MTHTENILTSTIQVLRKLRMEQNLTPHALIWGKWGVGKTVAAQRISRREPDVFYVKLPDGDISRSRLYRLLGFAIGCGARSTAESTLDIIKHHLLYYDIKPIFILDEVQRIIRRPNVLNELKDLSEDPDLEFSYVFVGDHTIPRLLASHDHSIFRRFVIKKELQPLTVETISELLREYKIQADPVQIFNFAKERSWTTLDASIVLQAVKNQKVEPTTEMLDKIAKALGR